MLLQIEAKQVLRIQVNPSVSNSVSHLTTVHFQALLTKTLIYSQRFSSDKMSPILILLFSMCIGYINCEKCPELELCQCFWDLLPMTTSCPIDILHMERGTIVQSRTQRLVLHIDSTKGRLSYDVNLWKSLHSVYTTDKMYTCSGGICNSMATTKKRFMATRSVGKLLTFIIPSTSSVKPNPTVDSQKRPNIKFMTPPSCFTTGMSMSTPIAGTCSTDIFVNDIDNDKTWIIYVPVLAVIAVFIMGIVIVKVIRYRQWQNRMAGQDNTSVCLYEMPHISPSASPIMESPASYGCMYEETDFVADRTRSKCEPVAKRTRSSRKDI